MIAPLAKNETERLEALRAFEILDTPPEPEFDELTRLASVICSAPIALISLIDPTRQWFKSCVGLDATETSRDIAFCAHAILGKELFVISDAAADARFRDNPLVTGEPYIRFYAGMPLTTPEGYNVGTLCIIDRVPRILTAKLQDAVRVLARQVVARLVLRRQVEELKVVVAEKERIERALRSSEAKFRNTIDRLAEGVFIVDEASNSFVDANAAVLKMLGYSLEEFTALPQCELAADETPATFASRQEQIRAALAREGRCDLGRRKLRCKDGAVVPVEVRATSVPNGGSGLNAYIVRDVTDRVEYENRLFEYQSGLEEANAKLKELATTDGLTGINNRAAFDEKLTEEFERASRHGRALSLIVLDVDHFKSFNDTFGHPAGDDVLRAVAVVLKGTARSIDTAARYGGEEFAIILPETDFCGAMVLAERCRRAVASFAWDKRAITVSVGVSTLRTTTNEPRELVREADEALYRSKQTGRNRVHHNQPVEAKPEPVAV
jgi:diguanylate cyclase (GGDEF)-like protein/PAS domain S-box-containing protein